MYMLRWMRENAPAALKSVDDKELKSCMESAWDGYTNSGLVIIDPNMSVQEKWLIARSLPEHRCSPILLELIDSGIDIMPFTGGQFRECNNYRLSFLVKLCAAGCPKDKAREIVLSTSDYSTVYSEDYIKLTRLGFDWNAVDLNKLDEFYVSAIIRLVEKGIWDNAFASFIEQKWYGQALDDLYELFKLCSNDISWLSAEHCSSVAVSHLAYVSSKLGYVPDCLKISDLQQTDIDFFEKVGRTEDGRLAMRTVRCDPMRELLIKYPQHSKKIIEFDSHCSLRLLNFILKYLFGWNAMCIEDKCRLLSDRLYSFYDKYPSNSPEELVDKLLANGYKL